MDALELTRSLVRIDSTTGREGPVAAFLAAVLEQEGWIVVRQPVDEGRFNVYAHLGGPEVVFSTHLDTVPPFIDLREDETWLHGRGTCDAKGLAAAMIAAAERLRATGETRIGLLFVVGEENGSEGAAAAARLEPRGRFLINGEPTENQLTIGQKGVLRANLVATGRAAHSAYPDEGESAIVPLLDTLQRVQHITLPPHPVLGDMTLNIGRIEGGRAPNVIPDHARAELLFRTVMPHDDLKRAIEAALEPRVTVTYPLEIPSVVSTAPKGWQTTVVSFASDLPFLASWGEGYQLGPGTIRVAHTAEERIRKTDLQRGIVLYEKLARDLLARGAA
ncbi:MAG: peptidase [Gemmatimonadetes bacterium]|nr:peptidase [Gemmatimonadota bacterium]